MASQSNGGSSKSQGQKIVDGIEGDQPVWKEELDDQQLDQFASLMDANMNTSSMNAVKQGFVQVGDLHPQMPRVSSFLKGQRPSDINLALSME